MFDKLKVLMLISILSVGAACAGGVNSVIITTAIRGGSLQELDAVSENFLRDKDLTPAQKFEILKISYADLRGNIGAQRYIIDMVGSINDPGSIRFLMTAAKGGGENAEHAINSISRLIVGLSASDRKYIRSEMSNILLHGGKNLAASAGSLLSREFPGDESAKLLLSAWRMGRLPEGVFNREIILQMPAINNADIKDDALDNLLVQGFLSRNKFLSNEKVALITALFDQRFAFGLSPKNKEKMRKFLHENRVPVRSFESMGFYEDAVVYSNWIGLYAGVQSKDEKGKAAVMVRELLLDKGAQAEKISSVLLSPEGRLISQSLSSKEREEMRSVLRSENSKKARAVGVGSEMIDKADFVLKYPYLL